MKDEGERLPEDEGSGPRLQSRRRCLSGSITPKIKDKYLHNAPERKGGGLQRGGKVRVTACRFRFPSGFKGEHEPGGGRGKITQEERGCMEVAII